MATTAKSLEPAALLELGQEAARIIEERLVSLRRSRIRVATSAANTRASSIGHPCERFLFFERTANEKRTPPDERLQAIFELGDLHESHMLRQLEDAGIRIVQRGRDFLDRGLQLSGHVDARLAVPYGSSWLEMQSEVKSMAPWGWEAIDSVEDMTKSDKPWLRRYPAQLQTYLYLSAEPLGMFILVNKSTGQVKFLPMPLDLDYTEQLLRKAERVRDAVAAGVAPPQIQDRETCASCPFLAFCGPDLLAGPGIQFVADEVGELLDQRERLESAADDYRAVEKRLKEILGQKGEYVAGRWVISVKESPRKAYQVEASTMLRRTYKRLPEGVIR